MGVRFPTAYSNTFVGPLPASAAETVVLVTPPINEPIDNATVFIFGAFSLTVGASSTSISVNLRRGTTAAGALVNTASFAMANTAAATIAVPFTYFDNPGVVAGQQYCLTVQQNAATGAGTWRDGSLMAMVL